MKYFLTNIQHTKRLVVTVQNNKQRLYSEIYSQIEVEVRDKMTFKLYVLFFTKLHNMLNRKRI